MISEKQRSAEAACEYVKDGMIVGLGTGSTAEFAIKKIGELVRNGLSIRGIPTSDATKILAESEGIPLIDFSETMFIDLTIDGADEIDTNLNMIKGGGAALLREKIVASASREEIIIVSGSKLVQQLGAFPLPVEVIPFGWQVVFNQLESLQGNPEQLEQHLNMIPGVVENGLFINLCTRMIMTDGENIIIKNCNLN